MKLPYRPDAKTCYTDVKKVPVLGEAIDRMIAESDKDASFESRLKAILDLRMKSAEAYRERPLHDAALKEESAYVCAGDDVLEAAFMGEIERIASLPQTDRAKPLDAVTTALDSTELDPRWNTYIRPRIAGRVAEVRAGR
jgi:hypothetical protein